MKIFQLHIIKVYLTFIFMFCATAGARSAGGSFNYKFIENKGQWSDEILYQVQIPAGVVRIKKTGIGYLLHQSTDDEHGHALRADQIYSKKFSGTFKAHYYEMNFLNSSPSMTWEGMNADNFRMNYFKGKSSDVWAADIKAYEEVKINNVWPGIHFRMYQFQGRLKYDFIIEPGAEPKSIRLEMEGAEQISLDNKQLKVLTSLGEVMEQEPIAFQYDGEKRKEVEAAYILDHNSVSFSVKSFNKRNRLVIDPELVFSSYSGSLSDNWGYTATYDDEGHLYGAGIVMAPGFPTTPGAIQPDMAGGLWDVGIMKFDPSGTDLIYATYLGGSDSEIPSSLVVDKQGNLIVFGVTGSVDFPVTTNAVHKKFNAGIIDSSLFVTPLPAVSFTCGTDLFVTKISKDGKKLIGSTYAGGSGYDGIQLPLQPLTKNYGDQFRGEVVVDDENNIIIATNTSSDDFPVFKARQPIFGGGTHDGVICKFNATLDAVHWATYMGGSGTDAVYSVKPLGDNKIVFGGGTTSNDIKTSANAYKKEKSDTVNADAFVGVINQKGDSILACTYLGTTEYDQAYFVDVDTAGNIFALGQTQGAYPVTSGLYANPNSGQFIHKLDSNLSQSIFSTVIGSGRGSIDFSPTAFLVNDCGNIYISGWGGRTNSPISGYLGGSTFNLPITSNAYQSTTDGSDFYFMVLLEGARELLYATYFGSNKSNEHVDGGTSRFDKKGMIYQAVCAGCGGDDNFPTTPGAWSNVNRSSVPYRNCNMGVIKFDLASLKARFTTNTPEFDNEGITVGCEPFEVVFLNRSIGGLSYEWDFGEGTTSTKRDSIYITYPDTGRFEVTLTARDINTCIREDIARGAIQVYTSHFSLSDSTKICFDEPVRLEASGAVSYAWRPEAGLSDTDVSAPLANPEVTTLYIVDMVDENGCFDSDTVLVEVVPKITSSFTYSKEYFCNGAPLFTFVNNSENAEYIEWDFGDGTSSRLDSIQLTYTKTDTFKVVLNSHSSFCVESASETVTSIPTFIPNVFTPNDDKKNPTFKVVNDQPVEVTILNRWGEKVFESDNYQNDWKGDDKPSGIYYYEVKIPNSKQTCIGWIHVLH